jgi:hypothetical protein
MSRLAQSEIALSALAVCLLVMAQAAGLPVVLCIAGSGHIAVEALDSSCCSRISGANPGWYAGHPGCGGCTDIPIEAVSQKNAPRTATHTAALPALPETIDPIASGPPSGMPLATLSDITILAGPPPLLRC